MLIWDISCLYLYVQDYERHDMNDQKQDGLVVFKCSKQEQNQDW